MGLSYDYALELVKNYNQGGQNSLKNKHRGRKPSKNCYEIDGLPRTNNDLEHLFSKWRHHQRRCTGRKVAPQSFVLRGSVQLVAAVATQLKTFGAEHLATVPIETWQQVRLQLENYQHKRVEQRRFRRSPAAYLAHLEAQLFQLILPL